MNRIFLLSFLAFSLTIVGCAPEPESSETAQQATAATRNESDSFEEQVAEYIQKFPYKDTYNYAVRYTGGDAAKLWVKPSQMHERSSTGSLLKGTNLNNFLYWTRSCT